MGNVMGSGISCDTRESIKLLDEKSPMETILGAGPAMTRIFNNLTPREIVNLSMISSSFWENPEVERRKKLTELLHYVVRGDISAVEKILKVHPNNASLLLVKSCFKDLSRSQREFNASALQYVRWARDVKMLSLFLDYADKKVAKEQLDELEHHSNRLSQHGSSHSLNPLIELSQKYLDNPDNWGYYQSTKYWCEMVVKAQGDCPAWYRCAWSEEGEKTYWTLQDVTIGFARDPAGVRFFTEHTHSREVCRNPSGVIRGTDTCISASIHFTLWSYNKRRHDVEVHRRTEQHVNKSIRYITINKLDATVPRR